MRDSFREEMISGYNHCDVDRDRYLHIRLLLQATVRQRGKRGSWEDNGGADREKDDVEELKTNMRKTVNGLIGLNLNSI